MTQAIFIIGGTLSAVVAIGEYAKGDLDGTVWLLVAMFQFLLASKE